MDFNRNQFFLFGLLMVFFGFQFRMLDHFTLNDQTTKFLASIQDTNEKPFTQKVVESGGGSLPKQEVKPPIWLGYSLLSIGAVLILHSITMPKPGG